MSMCSAVLQEFDNEAENDAPRARARADRQALVEAASQIDVARRAGAARRREPRRHRRLVRARTKPPSRGEKPPAPSSTAEILAAHDKGVKTVKETLGKLGDEGLPSDVDGQGGRQHADVDAEDGARARDRDESLDSSPRTAVGVPAAARRAGAVDLRSERRREPVRGAHLSTVTDTGSRSRFRCIVLNNRRSDPVRAWPFGRGRSR